MEVGQKEFINAKMLCFRGFDIASETGETCQKHFLRCMTTTEEKIGLGHRVFFLGESDWFAFLNQKLCVLTQNF